MSDFWLKVYPTFYLALIFVGCKAAKKKEFMNDPWGRPQAKMIQAAACIGVVMHHVTQEITGYGMIDKGPITVFSGIGILFTSLFFFFSGYGLVISIRVKENYLKNFLWHRLPVILFPFWTVNIISVLVRIFYMNIRMKTADIIKYSLGLVLIDGNGWYIVEIFLLYLAFYLIFRMIKNEKTALAFLSGVSIILILKGLHSGHDTSVFDNHWFKGEWWYNSTIVFVMGLWTAHFKEKLLSFAQKHYSFLLGLTSVLFFGMYFVEKYVRNVYGYYSVTPITQRISNETITLYVQMIFCLLFTCLVLLISLKISLGNIALKGISTISPELFLAHGIFLKDIYDTSKMSDAFLYIAVLLGGIVLAVMVHFVNAPLIASIHNYGRIKGKKLSEYERRLYKEGQTVNYRKSILLILIFVVVTGMGWKVFTAWIRPYFEYQKEAEELARAQVGDTVRFGRYDTTYIDMGAEHLEWIVLKKEENALMLITKEGIAGSVYHRKHEPVRWQDSDLCAFLNNTLYEDIFSCYEQKMILDNPVSGERLSLLSEAEAVFLFHDEKSRQLAITEVAEKSGTNINLAGKTNYWDLKGYRSSWWWLRGNNLPAKTAPIVTEDGVIFTDKKYVNKPNGAVRPVVWVERHTKRRK